MVGYLLRFVSVTFWLSIGGEGEFVFLYSLGRFSGCPFSLI